MRAAFSSSGTAGGQWTQNVGTGTRCEEERIQMNLDAPPCQLLVSFGLARAVGEKDKG